MPIKRTPEVEKYQEENRLLTDEQYKECIPCYCGKCGTQLWMHVLYPLVGRDSLTHYCVAKPPVLFKIEHMELKPMDMPSTKIFELDYRYSENDIAEKDFE